jgi:hypothetical protein
MTSGHHASEFPTLLQYYADPVSGIKFLQVLDRSYLMGIHRAAYSAADGQLIRQYTTPAASYVSHMSRIIIVIIVIHDA